MPIGVAGAVALGSAAIGAGASIYGSSQAAGAAKDAAGVSKQQYYQTRGDLVPYIDTGNITERNALSLAQGSPTGGGPDYVSQAAPYIGQAAGYIGQQAGAVGQAGSYLDNAAANLPGQMTQAQLEATPGYQFTLDQGLKSVQSANAAKGLGVSGAALKGAATYATGLADKTYLDQFNVAQQRFTDYLGLGTNALAVAGGYGNVATGYGNIGSNSLNLNTAQQGNLTNQFNRLSTLSTLGANAGAGLGTQGTALANQAGNYINQAGLASAAGTTGVANALAGGANNYLAYNAYQNRTNASNPSNANSAGTIGLGSLFGGGNSLTYNNPTGAYNPSADPRGLFSPSSPGY
jgi:hypothetical protein